MMEIYPGKKFGDLRAVEQVFTSKSKKPTKKWLFECSCGNKIKISIFSLAKNSRTSCGCRSNKLLTSGTRYGYLTVLGKSEKVDKHGRKLYDCMCDCGKKVVAKAYLLKNGEHTSCGCSRIKNRQKNKRWAGHNGISGTLFWHLKLFARRRNIAFDLTIEDLWNLFLKQGGKCALSNRELFFSPSGKKTDLHLRTASLDRRDNSKPYSIDNCQWVHRDINFMKNRYDEKYFLETCKEIVDYNKVKNADK